MYKAGDIVVTRQGKVVMLFQTANISHPLRYSIGKETYTVTLDGFYHLFMPQCKHDIARHATDEERAKVLGKTWIPNAGAQSVAQDKKDCYLVQLVGFPVELRKAYDTLDAAKAAAERIAEMNSGVVRVLKIVAECKLETKVIWL